MTDQSKQDLKLLWLLEQTKRYFIEGFGPWKFGGPEPIKEVSNPTVWVIEFSLVNPQYTWIPYVNYTNWVRRPISSYDVIQRMGKSWADVRVVPDGALTRKYIPTDYARTY